MCSCICVCVCVFFVFRSSFYTIIFFMCWLRLRWRIKRLASMCDPVPLMRKSISVVTGCATDQRWHFFFFVSFFHSYIYIYARDFWCYFVFTVYSMLHFSYLLLVCGKRQYDEIYRKAATIVWTMRKNIIITAGKLMQRPRPAFLWKMTMGQIKNIFSYEWWQY